MTRAVGRIVLAAVFSGIALGQSVDTLPRFAVADIHSSPGNTNSFFRTSYRNGRYEVHNATMLDLIATAYKAEPLKVAGGPSWLEFNRFDITALAPAGTPQDTLILMLRSLLSERFGLVVHNDTQPLAGFVLSAGKGKPKLKEADPAGKTGCQAQPVPPPPPTPGQINVPMIGFSCHNMSMEAFATALKGPAGGGYITNTVVDSTGLRGSWDFEYQFTNKGLIQIAGSDGITLADAIDKQLGLKLEEQKIPTAVTVVDKVSEKPTDNPPDLAQTLPPLPPAEFEVADVKPSSNGTLDPRSLQVILSGAGIQRSGRVNLPGLLYPLKQLIIIAWNLNSNEDIPGAPKWLDTARFDIIAKLPDGFLGPNSTPPPLQDIGPMLQALLIDRFKMKAHFEKQEVTAYTLVAAKPKLKKADPSAHTNCKTANGPRTDNGGGPVLPSRIVSCQNMTMAQFAGQLQNLAGPYVHYPVVDATGLEGGWDFSFSYSPIPAALLAGLRGAPATTPFGTPAAADPVGGTSLFDAFEKQLGLKLEAQKRSYPVFVIDHIEEKPTEN